MREPRGVVDWEEEVDLVLVMEGVWVMEGRLLRGLAVDGEWGVGDELLEEDFFEESRLSLLMLGSRDGFGASANVTILMPLLVLVLAGMNSVVLLSAAGTAIRWGWLALHPTEVSWVPVE